MTVTPETVTADPDTGEGMSTRAIAPIVGVDNATVHRDIEGVANATPSPVPAPREVVEVITADPQTGEVIEDPEPRTVTGLDGKT